MLNCPVCGNPYDKPPRIVSADRFTYVVETLEASLKVLPASCTRCSSATASAMTSPPPLPTGLLHGQQGKIGWLFLWALGIPIPLLLVFYVLRGCT